MSSQSEKHTLFETKMIKLYTIFQIKTAQKTLPPYLLSPLKIHGFPLYGPGIKLRRSIRGFGEKLRLLSFSWSSLHFFSVFRAVTFDRLIPYQLLWLRCYAMSKIFTALTELGIPVVAPSVWLWLTENKANFVALTPTKFPDTNINFSGNRNCQNVSFTCQCLFTIIDFWFRIWETSLWNKCIDSNLHDNNLAPRRKQLLHFLHCSKEIKINKCYRKEMRPKLNQPFPFLVFLKEGWGG